jgi:hypothetical protein
LHQLPTPTVARTALNVRLEGIVACGHQDCVGSELVEIGARRQHVVDALKLRF